MVSSNGRPGPNLRGRQPGCCRTLGPARTPRPSEFVSLNCGFEVNVELTGKVKNISLPDGRTVISTSPGLKVKLTGVESQKSLSYVITGGSYYTFLDDTIEVVSTGRNILLLPTPDGLYLTTGNVNYALDYNFD